MSTTTFERLANELPQSETHWRDIAAKAHRSRALPGDESAAKTHELHIWEIRQNLSAGSSREARICPRCFARSGAKYMLIFGGGKDQCGSCYWTGP